MNKNILIIILGLGVENEIVMKSFVLLITYVPTLPQKNVHAFRAKTED